MGTDIAAACSLPRGVRRVSRTFCWSSSPVMSSRVSGAGSWLASSSGKPARISEYPILLRKSKMSCRASLPLESSIAAPFSLSSFRRGVIFLICSISTFCKILSYCALLSTTAMLAQLCLGASRTCSMDGKVVSTSSGRNANKSGYPTFCRCATSDSGSDKRRTLSGSLSRGIGSIDAMSLILLTRRNSFEISTSSGDIAERRLLAAAAPKDAHSEKVSLDTSSGSSSTPDDLRYCSTSSPSALARASLRSTRLGLFLTSGSSLSMTRPLMLGESIDTILVETISSTFSARTSNLMSFGISGKSMP